MYLSIYSRRLNSAKMQHHLALHGSNQNGTVIREPAPKQGTRISRIDADQHGFCHSNNSSRSGAAIPFPDKSVQIRGIGEIRVPSTGGSQKTARAAKILDLCSTARLAWALRFSVMQP